MKLRNITCSFLALSIVLSCSFLSVSAFHDDARIHNKEAVSACQSLGILSGRANGNFDPSTQVTRAEMAKMIALIYLGGMDPEPSTQQAPAFNDIKGHWAEAHISFCAANGILTGSGDGSFAPDKGVSHLEAAKMLLILLGYKADSECFTGEHWAEKVTLRASDVDLFRNMPSTLSLGNLSRDNAAQMIWNALNTKQVEYIAESVFHDGEPVTVETARQLESAMTLKERHFDSSPEAAS